MKNLRSNGYDFCRFRSVTTLLALAMLLFTPQASADLLISPTRVLVTSDQDTARVTLRNTGSVVRSYRLDWREMRREPNGSFVTIENPQEGDRIASPMLRFSPRQITLEPGEIQTIRIQFRPHNGVETGEYRSHLRFLTVGGPSSAEGEAQTSGVVLQMGLAFTIPVIARIGSEPPNVETSISRVQARIDRNPSDGSMQRAIDVTVERRGTHSSFGDLNVTMQHTSGEPPVILGRASEFTVFADVGSRQISIPLRDDIQIPPGALVRISYEGKDELFGRVLAEQVLQIQ